MKRRVRVTNGIHAVNIGYMDYGPATCTAESRESVNAYRKDALRAARDFSYPTEIITAIIAATTETQICSAMRRGRAMKWA